MMHGLPCMPSLCLLPLWNNESYWERQGLFLGTLAHSAPTITLMFCASFQISESYAFLPREAVTRFLMSCSECQKRMHLNPDGTDHKGSHSAQYWDLKAFFFIWSIYRLRCIKCGRLKQFNKSYYLISSSCEQWTLCIHSQNNSGSSPRRKFQQYKYYFFFGFSIQILFF